eukprot:359555-Chlamydomonas_euryale.AAC.10
MWLGIVGKKQAGGHVAENHGGKAGRWVGGWKSWRKSRQVGMWLGIVGENRQVGACDWAARLVGAADRQPRDRASHSTAPSHLVDPCLPDERKVRQAQLSKRGTVRQLRNEHRHERSVDV